jgi:hypothetical protein
MKNDVQLRHDVLAQLEREYRLGDNADDVDIRTTCASDTVHA